MATVGSTRLGIFDGRVHDRARGDVEVCPERFRTIALRVVVRVSVQQMGCLSSRAKAFHIGC
jgi:hypothetical protein